MQHCSIKSLNTFQCKLFVCFQKKKKKKKIEVIHSNGFLLGFMTDIQSG